MFAEQEDKSNEKSSDKNGRNKGKTERTHEESAEPAKRKLTYKERLEMAQLEKDIAALEEKQKSIEEALCSGKLSVDELTEKSKLLSTLKDEIDEKSMRWLELDEFTGAARATSR
jgi:ATP-binding cassette subfamily F protein uup